MEWLMDYADNHNKAVERIRRVIAKGVPGAKLYEDMVQLDGVHNRRKRLQR